MKKHVENAPLLYIVQPNLGPKTCYMQQMFRTKKEKPSYPPPSFANFRDMDTIERIEFLATLPNELRPVTCELKTKNRTYEGIIQKCDSKKVFFTFSGEEKTITIPLEHIVSVSLIGKS